MERKYELTEQTVQVYGKRLYRIRAIRDFSDVAAGVLGGFVQSEENLSHEGDAWIHGDALVFDKALICENAFVSGRASVFGDACVCGDAWVYGEARVFERARVSGEAHAFDKASISGDARVLGNASVFGYASVFGSASLRDRVRARDQSQVGGSSVLSGAVSVSGDVCLKGAARMDSDNDLLFFSGVGEDRGAITVYKTDSGAECVASFFHGSLALFEQEVLEKRTNGSRSKEYEAIVRLAKIRFAG